MQQNFGYKFLTPYFQLLGMAEFRNIVSNTDLRVLEVYTGTLRDAEYTPVMPNQQQENIRYSSASNFD
jgi:hypothetical protein